jgi:hypothetical protein
VDHVPVRADLSDLADQIRWCKTHDAECRAIAKNAEQLWTKYLAREGLLDYIQLVRIHQRTPLGTLGRPWDGPRPPS